MGFGVSQQIRRRLTRTQGVQFRIKFSPDTVLNFLEIRERGVIIATDSNVSNETYSLPPGVYVASLRFLGDGGTTGKLTIETPSEVKDGSATIHQGHARETIPLGFEL